VCTEYHDPRRTFKSTEKQGALKIQTTTYADMALNLKGIGIMNVITGLMLALACTAVGAVAGFRVALVSEHNRLERNKALVRQSHEGVWSEKSDGRALAVARQIYAKDFVVHSPAGGSTGFDEFFEGIRENRADFPDWREKVESIVAEGDFVAVRFVSSGTQARDLNSQEHVQPAVPSKGRSVHMNEIEVFRISDDKLAEVWDLWDNWDYFGQLGLYDADHWPESVCGPAQKR
jgi:predicted ester cyclase